MVNAPSTQLASVPHSWWQRLQKRAGFVAAKWVERVVLALWCSPNNPFMDVSNLWPTNRLDGPWIESGRILSEGMDVLLLGSINHCQPIKFTSLELFIIVDSSGYRLYHMMRPWVLSEVGGFQDSSPQQVHVSCFHYGCGLNWGHCIAFYCRWWFEIQLLTEDFLVKILIPSNLWWLARAVISQVQSLSWSKNL